MAGIKDVASVWKNIKEIDLKSIRDLATNPLRIALVGAQGVGRHTLAEQMRTDPARPGMHTQSTLALLSLDAAPETLDTHLIILLVDATRADLSEEQALAKKWSEAGKNMLVFINKIDLVNGNIPGDAGRGWKASGVVYGSINDIVSLQREFIPTVLELLPQQHIALGRQFPLFRLTIARQLINETCLSNSAYSFSTGLAEIVPVLDLPLNVTDMVVLTKSQAFLAYKLGLLLGFSTRWQDYVTEFGSVIGSGFLWRQVARSLVGLIPAWGIIPKVAVAYSGTYVVGNAILGWYLSGRKLTPKQMGALSTQAFTRGKEFALRLARSLPKRKREKGELTQAGKYPMLEEETVIIKEGEQLLLAAPAGGIAKSVKGQKDGSASRVMLGEYKEKVKKLRQAKRNQISKRNEDEAGMPENVRQCAECGKPSSADAYFCQYCGVPFDQ